jgi:hypothetical protein
MPRNSQRPDAGAEPVPASGMPLVRHGHARWLVRAPGQHGALSPDEAAHVLKAKRAELRERVDWRRDVAGMPEHARDELVDEAIGLAVMSSNQVRDEQHLQGAFWTSIAYLLAEHRAGRRDLHLGPHRRVQFEPVAKLIADDGAELFDLVAARERFAATAELMVQLDPLLQVAPRSLATALAELLTVTTDRGDELGPLDPKVVELLRSAEPAQLKRLLAEGFDYLERPIEELLAPLDSATLLGPDGKPANPASGQDITLSVQQVTAELMARVARDPQLLYALHPRQFEEIVAELFAQQGYEVTLTASSNDGGADLYVVDRRNLGSFLYIVECKRYRVDRPVGVGIVRQLFGVVQALNATAGIVATTSHFTRGAHTFAKSFQYQLSLHDFVALKKWLRESAAP